MLFFTYFLFFLIYAHLHFKIQCRDRLAITATHKISPLSFKQEGEGGCRRLERSLGVKNRYRPLRSTGQSNVLEKQPTVERGLLKASQAGLF